MEDNIRWKQRFYNFEKAYLKLKEISKVLTHDISNEIYQMALIKAFEFTYELGWKTTKDYLKYKGIDAKSPRDVIKEAFAIDIIKDGQAWIDMLEDRNLMAHTYDEYNAKLATKHILEEYIENIEQVYLFFKNSI